jgi:hypothetical protein
LFDHSIICGGTRLRSQLLRRQRQKDWKNSGRPHVGNKKSKRATEAEVVIHVVECPPTRVRPRVQVPAPHIHELILKCVQFPFLHLRLYFYSVLIFWKPHIMCDRIFLLQQEHLHILNPVCTFSKYPLPFLHPPFPGGEWCWFMSEQRKTGHTATGNCSACFLWHF